MTLDDTIKEELMKLGNQTAGLYSTQERIKAGKGPSDNGYYSKGLAQLILANTDGELSQEQLELYQNIPEEELTPILHKYLPTAYKNARKKLTSKVTSNAPELIDEISGRNITDLLLNIPAYTGNSEELQEFASSHRDYLKWKKIAENGDIKAYIDSIKNPLLKEIVQKYKDKKEIMLDLIKKRDAIQRSKYLSKFIDESKLDHSKMNEENQAEEIAKALKVDDAKAYLKETLMNLDKDNREKFYETLGINYSNYLLQQEEEERNKDAKKAVEKAA